MARIKITRAKKGEAPETACSISVNADQGGSYCWTGVLDAGGAALAGGGSEKKFPTIHEAEADAVAWAMSHGATHLVIEGPNA
jgi:hypothetical protein